MAIISPAGGALVPQNISGITLTSGSQSQPVARAPMANRKGGLRSIIRGSSNNVIGSGRPAGGPGENHKGQAGNPSTGYQLLDQQILALDAEYDQLLPTTVWDTYAANILGKWILCANCDVELSGKKLYRQYNSNRLALGLPRVTAPIDNTEYADFLQWYCYKHPGTGAFDEFFVSVNNMSNLYAFFLKQGDALNNPLMYWADIPRNGTHTYPSDEWTFCDLLPEGVITITCAFTADGAPALQGTFGRQMNH
jgi:hypothetical protein